MKRQRWKSLTIKKTAYLVDLVLVVRSCLTQYYGCSQRNLCRHMNCKGDRLLAETTCMSNKKRFQTLENHQGHITNLMSNLKMLQELSSLSRLRRPSLRDLQVAPAEDSIAVTPWLAALEASCSFIIAFFRLSTIIGTLSTKIEINWHHYYL